MIGDSQGGQYKTEFQAVLMNALQTQNPRDDIVYDVIEHKTDSEFVKEIILRDYMHLNLDEPHSSLYKRNWDRQRDKTIEDEVLQRRYNKEQPIRNQHTVPQTLDMS